MEDLLSVEADLRVPSQPEDKGRDAVSNTGPLPPGQRVNEPPAQCSEAEECQSGKVQSGGPTLWSRAERQQSRIAEKATSNEQLRKHRRRPLK